MFSLSLIAAVPFVLGAFVAAQSNPTVVCVAGQCIQGYSNITAGAVLAASNVANSVPVRLLPGQYTSSTSPQLLHDLLTSSSASLTLSPGFANTNSSSLTLPLNLALEPGIAIYPNANYSGPSTYTALPSNNASRDSTSVTASSVILSSNVWAAVSSGPSSADRLILWDSIADLSQLPAGSALSSISILDIQSSACSPPCAGSGICSASGTCTCPSGFSGASCESCAPGFFGPNCQACPAGCGKCDDGTSGSGICLVPQTATASCNCLNGVCGSDGQCTCNAGWANASNGTACAQCAPGFFLDQSGNCKVCQLGCTQCADGSGQCIACKNGFTQDANDRTKCIALQTTTSTGTVCPDGSFSSGTTCTPCSPLCQTCSGATSNDCIICGAGQVSLNGQCVGTDSNGVCAGSALIADNNKHECDACPAKCTACKIPNFNVASTVSQLQCTGCLPGFVLSKGVCVQSCPLGTFLDPKDNLTCTACDSTCSSCAGSSTFCLTCANNQLASSGKCVATCPSNSFSSSGACLACHPDCASCTGSSFNQCTSCPPDRPVLTNGRCLPTCSQSQFFDKTSSSCQSCDASCSSCSGAGPSNCLSCSSSTSTLRGGTCATTTCGGSSAIVPGLGLCLSDLVAVPKASNTLPPLPTITGINTPATPTPSASTSSSSSARPLSWWEILLMALGCAFIFVAFLFCWRRHARKKRAQATAIFAVSKNLRPNTGWRWRLMRFGERLFGHRQPRTRYVPGAVPVAITPYRDIPEPEGRGMSMQLEKLRERDEEAQYERDMDKLLDQYDYSRAGSSRGPSPLPSLRDFDADRQPRAQRTMANDSIYSQVTGLPLRGPEPRQPVRTTPRDLLPSRFSATSYTTSVQSPPRDLSPPPAPRDLMDTTRPPTPAQEYARLVQGQEAHHPEVHPPVRDEEMELWLRAEVDPGTKGAYWVQSNHTGGSANTNPFLR